MGPLEGSETHRCLPFVVASRGGRGGRCVLEELLGLWLCPAVVAANLEGRRDLEKLLRPLQIPVPNCDDELQLWVLIFMSADKELDQLRRRFRRYVEPHLRCV